MVQPGGNTGNVLPDNKFLEYKIIGKSTENRRIDVVFIGNMTNPDDNDLY